jgi:DASH complex subunit DAM1
METAHTQSRTRSLSRSRPTTPLRPPSRSSANHNPQNPQNPQNLTSSSTALDTLEPLFTELADSMADLEANFMHLQLMHESLARFGESFAAFLYGLNVRAFCVDFSEAPVQESFERWRLRLANSGARGSAGLGEEETTFMYGSTFSVPISSCVSGHG